MASANFRDYILTIVKSRCEKSVIRWQLLDAIICVESAYDRYAIRYEKDHDNFYFPEEFANHNHVTLDTEVQLQKFSYGLCQIMGSTLRRLQYYGSLAQLFEAEINIIYALLLLEGLHIRYHGNEDDILCAYNHGKAEKNADGTYVVQDYVDKVHKFMGKTS